MLDETFLIQSYRLALEFVREYISSHFHDKLNWIILFFKRGFAIVLAEDVPAIAKTRPPSKQLTIVSLIYTNLNRDFISRCLEFPLPRIQRVLTWNHNLMVLPWCEKTQNYSATLESFAISLLTRISQPWTLFFRFRTMRTTTSTKLAPLFFYIFFHSPTVQDGLAYKSVGHFFLYIS